MGSSHAAHTAANGVHAHDSAVAAADTTSESCHDHND